jgi:hypothetical protein
MYRVARRQRSSACTRRCWFEADFIVDRISESLLAAKVLFRRLDTPMTEQKLDLFKLPFPHDTGGRANPRKSPYEDGPQYHADQKVIAPTFNSLR